MNPLLAVGAFVLIYGLASIGIAMAFRRGRIVLNILIWVVLMAAVAVIHFSSSFPSGVY